MSLTYTHTHDIVAIIQRILLLTDISCEEGNSSVAFITERLKAVCKCREAKKNKELLERL